MDTPRTAGRPNIVRDGPRVQGIRHKAVADRSMSTMSSWIIPCASCGTQMMKQYPLTTCPSCGTVVDLSASKGSEPTPIPESPECPGVDCDSAYAYASVDAFVPASTFTPASVSALQSDDDQRLLAINNLVVHAPDQAVDENNPTQTHEEKQTNTCCPWLTWW